jgi:hypothetical protein
VVVFLHDGRQWYAYAFFYRKLCWELLSQTVYASRNSRQIPASLIEFAEKHNIRRVRIVLPQNIHKLDNIELPLDATAEELQTVINIAYSQDTGIEYGAVRVVASFADSFNMGGSPDTLFVAGVELGQLELYDKNCQSAGLQFDGCGILELAAVAAGTRKYENTRFLILRQDKGFYITCATDDSPMTASLITLNTNTTNTTAAATTLTTSTTTTAATINQTSIEKPKDNDRIQATARRLNTQKFFPLQIWHTQDVEPQKIEDLKNAIDPVTQLNCDDLSLHYENIAREIINTTEINAPSNGGAIVGLPEKEKDPYRAGTWLFCLTIIAALLLILINYKTLRSDLNAIKQKTDAWEKLKSERKKQKDKLNAIDNERRKNELIIQILNQKNPLPNSLNTILEELQKNMPIYTKLISIEQLENEELILTGYTYYQIGLFDLQKLLNHKLQKYKMISEFTSMEKIENSNQQKFILRIYKLE